MGPGCQSRDGSQTSEENTPSLPWGRTCVSDVCGMGPPANMFYSSFIDCNLEMTTINFCVVITFSFRCHFLDILNDTDIH